MACSKWLLAIGLVAGMFAPDSADAGCFRRRCALYTACGSWQCVEKEVCVPQWVTENRTVTCTESRPEQRQRTVTDPLQQAQDRAGRGGRALGQG